jgi:5'-phosphate synthase pdxT subunit
VLVGVLALQGDVAEHRAALAELDVTSRPVRRPEDMSGLDGIVLPGGESTTISMLLESSGLAEPLGKELAAGLPAFGTCAGMVLLASAISDGRPNQRCYGAIDLVVRRNGYGGQLDSFECDLEVASLGEAPLHGVFIRAPVVESVGSEVEVLAEVASKAGVAPSGTRGDGRGAFAPGTGADGSTTPAICRQGSVLAAACHPELTTDRRLHELFVSMIEKSVRTND